MEKTDERYETRWKVPKRVGEGTEPSRSTGTKERAGDHMETERYGRPYERYRQD